MSNSYFYELSKSVYVHPNAYIIILYLYFCLQLPTAIADNAGYDSSELIANLRAAHAKGNSTAGLGEHWIELHIIYIAVLISGLSDSKIILLQ